MADTKKGGLAGPPLVYLHSQSRSALLERKPTEALVELGNAATLIELARTTTRGLPSAPSSVSLASFR